VGDRPPANDESVDDQKRNTGPLVTGNNSMSTGEPGRSERAEDPDTVLQRSVEGSRILSGARTGVERTTAFVRGSYIYRWFTADPDPEVIVIDLRDTWTVGPIIGVLDRILGFLAPVAADSRVAAAVRTVRRETLAAPLRVGGLGVVAFASALLVGSFATGSPGGTTLLVGVGLLAAGLRATRDDRDWATLRKTRPVELLVAAFEPPDPPEQTQRPHQLQREENDDY
jgi:hypothetical protein